MTIQKITLDHPLRHLAKDGLGSYQPVFRGNALVTEDGTPEVSLGNLCHMLDEGARLTRLEITETGVAYFVFHTCEAYLATGFGIYSMDDPRTTHFAEFLVMAAGGDLEKWLAFLTAAFGPDHRGPIALNPQIEAKAPKVFPGD